MNTALTAVMTPQLMDDKAEFKINENQEGWIVGIDNVTLLIMCILNGTFQTKFGPNRVKIKIYSPLNVKILSIKMSKNGTDFAEKTFLHGSLVHHTQC